MNTTTKEVQHPIPESEVQSFFDDFVGAFSSFDGRIIAQRYMAPFLSADDRGELQLFLSTDDVGKYFDGVISRYRDQGCKACRYSALSVTPMGNNSALATVSWTLLADNDQIHSTWRESYNLTRTTAGLRIFASVDHAT